MSNKNVDLFVGNLKILYFCTKFGSRILITTLK